MDNASHVIDVDLAAVWKTDKPNKRSDTDFKTMLAFGDEVDVKTVTSKHIELRLKSFRQEKDGTVTPIEQRGFIVLGGVKPEQVLRPIERDDILKVDFVDVQQGDGTVIESPKGRIMLLDGGDNQLFARYLAGRYTGSTSAAPREIDCIVISHGDADHFAGLTQIRESETAQFSTRNAWKRLFIHPQRVFHNGLVKRPSTLEGKARKDTEMFGATATVGGKLYATELASDLLVVDDAQMNEPFRAWKRALAHYAERGAIMFRRLQLEDDDAFDFLREEGVNVEVLGPITRTIKGKPALKFLGAPAKGLRIGGVAPKFSGVSASHTINGNSIILRLTYGNVRFLFAGDLNEEAEWALLQKHPERLAADVFKVPHHGSADFLPEFLQAVSPVVSVVSSGDESARKEYMHPRANLMGALGRFSRVDEPLIFVTELVAFFAIEGWVGPPYHKLSAAGEQAIKKGGSGIVNVPKRGQFFSFSRAAFGLVKARTDGKRLLVYSNSANVQKKEVYAFTAAAPGDLKPAEVRVV